MLDNSAPFIKECGTRTVSFHGKASWVGWPTRWCLACLPAGRFFAWHRDYFIMTRNCAVIYLDLLPFRNFTVTLGFAAIYRDWQKTRQRDPSLPLWAGSDGT